MPSFRSCTTVGVSSWPSGIASLIAGWTTAIMTCWRPKPGWRVTWPLPPASRLSTLVRPRPAPDHGMWQASAAELERLDVRVPDATVGHARIPWYAAGQTCNAAVARQIAYGKRAECPGAFLSRATTWLISRAPSSTRLSACQVSVCSAGSVTTCGVAVRLDPGADGRPSACLCKPAAHGRGTTQVRTAFTKRSTLRPLSLMPRGEVS